MRSGRTQSWRLRLVLTAAVGMALVALGGCQATENAARVASRSPAGPPASDASRPETTETSRATASTTPPPTRSPAAVVTTTTVPSTTTVAPTTTLPPVTTSTLPRVRREPLTGRPLSDGEQPIARPALVVKIDNAPAARRNQAGLAAADIVFEEIVEGDLTRFAAAFHSRGSDVVGPIRSGRSQDLDLFTSFGEPLFAWSGGNPGVTRLVAESSFVDLNAVGDGEGYYRGPGRAPHDLYNATERLWAQTPDDHPGPAPVQFRYVHPTETFGGDPVAGADLLLGEVDVSWRWDAQAGAFVREQNGEPHVDVEHGQISADNVVVMVVEYRPSPIDARSPEAQTVGQGRVFLFASGRMVEARWWRDSADDPIKFVALDGVTPLGLVPGTTWVELAEARFEDSLLTADVELTIVASE